MSWQPTLILVCILFSLAVLLLSIRPKRSNRRTALPAPRCDERSSIEQFKRMHNV